MSKSDDAQAAAQEAREQAFLTGRPIAQLIEEFAPEWSVEPEVVEAWILRDPTFNSLEALDRAVAIQHQAVAENEMRRTARIRQRELKFSELADIIDAIPEKAVWAAALNIVGVSPSQSWREWIKKNSWEPENERDDAFAFANARIRARLNDGKLVNAPNN